MVNTKFLERHTAESILTSYMSALAENDGENFEQRAIDVLLHAKSYSIEPPSDFLRKCWHWVGLAEFIERELDYGETLEKPFNGQITIYDSELDSLYWGHYNGYLSMSIKLDLRYVNLLGAGKETLRTVETYLQDHYGLKCDIYDDDYFWMLAEDYWEWFTTSYLPEEYPGLDSGMFERQGRQNGHLVYRVNEINILEVLSLERLGSELELKVHATKADIAQRMLAQSVKMEILGIIDNSENEELKDSLLLVWEDFDFDSFISDLSEKLIVEKM